MQHDVHMQHDAHMQHDVHMQHDAELIVKCNYGLAEEGNETREEASAQKQERVKRTKEKIDVENMESHLNYLDMFQKIILKN